jgi:hypothetical protein
MRIRRACADGWATKPTRVSRVKSNLTLARPELLDDARLVFIKSRTLLHFSPTTSAMARILGQIVSGRI